MNFTDPHRLCRCALNAGLAAATLMALAACAKLPAPSLVFDDGPAPATEEQVTDKDPNAVLTGQRPVRRADPDIKSWPNLASVPDRPREFSSPVERQALLDRLQADRAEAGALAAQPGRSGAPASDIPVVPAAPPPVPQPVRR